MNFTETQLSVIAMMTAAIAGHFSDELEVSPESAAILAAPFEFGPVRLDCKLPSEPMSAAELTPVISDLASDVAAQISAALTGQLSMVARHLSLLFCDLARDAADAGGEFDVNAWLQQQAAEVIATAEAGDWEPVTPAARTQEVSVRVTVSNPEPAPDLRRRL